MLLPGFVYPLVTWISSKPLSHPPLHIPPFPYVICLQELNLKKIRWFSELCGLIKVDLQYQCIYAWSTSCKQIFSDRYIFSLVFCARVISVKSIDKSDVLSLLIIIIYFFFLFCFFFFVFISNFLILTMQHSLQWRWKWRFIRQRWTANEQVNAAQK